MRYFTPYHIYLPSDLDLEVDLPFQKLYPWLLILKQKRQGFHISYVYLFDKTFYTVQ